MEAGVTSAMRLSVIVPVLNEAHALPSLLEYLASLHRSGAEVMLDRGLGPLGAANPAYRINGSRYMLVEFPRMV